MRTMETTDVKAGGSDGSGGSSTGESSAQVLFGVPSYKSLLEDGLHVCKEASNALKFVFQQVSEALSGIGDPVLLGPLGSGLLLPTDSQIEVLVHVSGFTQSQQAKLVAATASALKSVGVEERGGSYHMDGYDVVVRFGDEEQFEPSSYLHVTTEDTDSDLRLASALPYRTRFLRSQPPMTKQFLRIIRYWSEVVHKSDWGDNLLSAPPRYFLMLLALEAFLRVSGDLDMEARMDAAIHEFFNIVVHLSPRTLITSDVYYKRETVTKAIACPVVLQCLRPPGFEGHPLVLDPACLTCNVALGVKDVRRLVEVADKDLHILCATNSPISLRDMQKQMDGMQLKLDRVECILSTLVSSSLHLATAFEVKAAGKSWLEKEPVVLLRELAVGPLKMDVITRPAAIAQNVLGYFTAEIDLQFVFPKLAKGTAVSDLLQLLPSLLRVKMNQLTVSSTFKSRSGKTEIKKAEGMFEDTCISTTPGSSSSCFGFTAAHIFDSAGYPFSQGGYGSEQDLQKLIQESSLTFKGEIILCA